MKRGMCFGNCVRRMNRNGQISGINNSPEQVVKNTGFKAQHLWDFNVHCDGMVECRRPDMISKERRLRS